MTAGRYPNFADPAAACTELDVIVYDAVVYGDVLVRVTSASTDAGAGVRQGQPDRYLREHRFPGVTVSDEISEISLWALGAGFTLASPGWTCQDRTWHAHYVRWAAATVGAGQPSRPGPWAAGVSGGGGGLDGSVARA